MPEVTCNNCQAKNAADANFCSNCGTRLERDAERADEPHTMTFHIETTAPEVADEFTVEEDDLPPDGALVVVVRGPIAGTRLALTKDLTTAGRHPKSDLFLDDVTVSRRHVELTRGAGGFHLRDVGSLNGTYVNGERVDDADLRSGDEIQIGRYKLAFFARSR